MAQQTVPAPPARTSPSHLTPQLRDDLAILMANGARASDVIRTAVAHAADAYRRAWDTGDVPPDADPVIRSCTYSGELRPVQPAPTASSHSSGPPPPR